MKVKFLFAWYDLWIGFFWDSKKKWLYFLPIPCIGLIFKFGLDIEATTKEDQETGSVATQMNFGGSNVQTNNFQ